MKKFKSPAFIVILLLLLTVTGVKIANYFQSKGIRQSVNNVLTADLSNHWPATVKINPLNGLPGAENPPRR